MQEKTLITFQNKSIDRRVQHIHNDYITMVITHMKNIQPEIRQALYEQ